MTSYGRHSRQHKFRLWLKNMSVWVVKTTNAQMVSRCSRGHEESYSHGMSQFQIPMPIHISQTRRPWLGPQLTKRQAPRKPNTGNRPVANRHVFVPVAIETAETWNHIAVELTQELGRRITAVIDDPRETGFLFQRLSVALQRGNAVSFRSTFTTE